MNEPDSFADGVCGNKFETSDEVAAAAATTTTTTEIETTEAAATTTTTEAVTTTTTTEAAATTTTRIETTEAAATRTTTEAVAATTITVIENENENETSDPGAGQINFSFHCEELKIFRLTLRVLSLWCPQQACFVEKYVYPTIVNLLLMLMLASVVNMMADGAWNTVDVYMFLAIDLSMYLSHIFGLLYFRTRDLENNMLNFGLEAEHATEFKRALRKLKFGVILSYLFTTGLVLMFFNTAVWLQGRFLCNSSFKFLKGFASHFVCFLNYPTNFYGIGNSLTLSWMMWLFQQTCLVRLEDVHQQYITWTESVEDAIYLHITSYSRKIKSSCACLEKWFVTHNIILIVAIPFLFYDIVKAFKGIAKENAVHNGLFLGYLVYTIIIWVVPLYFAELIQVHDEEICLKVNEFCPSVIHGRDNPVMRTFHSRAEVNKLLTYLKTRRSGFLVGSYSFQFKLSIVSIFLAMVSLATKIIG